MSCIIFGYRRFYAIICKITHFFYPKRKNPPLFAHRCSLSGICGAVVGTNSALLREGAGHRDTSSVKRLLHYH